jgi:hypothetical protein
MKFFHAPTFICFLALGMFLVYISAPDNQTIYVYPTPDNVNKIQYKDKGGTCHSFSAKQVECSDNKKEIIEYPVN